MEALQRRPSCPMGCGQMQPTAICTNFLAKSLTDELEVSCRLEGCTWTGRFDRLSGHEETCNVRRLRDLEMQVQRVGDLDNRVAAQEQEILCLTASIDNKNTELEQLRSQVAEQDTVIRKLSSSQCEEIFRLKRMLSELETKRVDDPLEEIKEVACYSGLERLRCLSTVWSNF